VVATPIQGVTSAFEVPPSLLRYLFRPTFYRVVVGVVGGGVVCEASRIKSGSAYSSPARPHGAGLWTRQFPSGSFTTLTLRGIFFLRAGVVLGLIDSTASSDAPLSTLTSIRSGRRGLPGVLGAEPRKLSQRERATALDLGPSPISRTAATTVKTNTTVHFRSIQQTPLRGPGSCVAGLTGGIALLVAEAKLAPPCGTI